MSTINFEEANLRRFLEANDKFNMKDVPVKRISSQYKQKRMIDMSVIKNQEVKAEYIDLLISLFCRDNPYVFDVRKDSVRSILKLPSFLSDRNCFVKADRQEIRDTYGKQMRREYRNIINNCIIAVILYREDNKEVFEKDVWNLSSFTNRSISSLQMRYIDFSVLRNSINKEMLKQYMKYLLGTSSFADGVITNCKTVLFDFVDYINDKSLNDIVSDDIDGFLVGKKQPEVKNRVLYNFFEYLISHKQYQKENPVNKGAPWKPDYSKDTSMPTEYVVGQIMGNLHKADEVSKLIFLVSYSTGMRISDICSLTKDCLEYDGKGGYYINFYCKKMRGKPESCLVSEALFKLITTRISKLNEEGVNTVYLFPSVCDSERPYDCGTYRSKFKKYCLSWGIKNEDGTIYNYTTHQFRRYLATELYSNGVSSVTIQKCVLWHREIDMTNVYIRRYQEQGRKAYDEFLKRAGANCLPDWENEEMRRHVLPNGFCALSDVVGVCNGVFACLECEHFRTSKEFLPIHRQQLKQVQENLKKYEANGWINNISTAKKQISLLEGLISKLEGGDSNA